MLHAKVTEGDIIDAFLPSDYRHKVISCEIIENDSLPFSEVNFDLEIRVNVKTREEVYQYLEKLNQSSSCTFNIKSGVPDKKPNGPKSRSALRGFRKCCLNVKSSPDSKPQEKGKNTSCDACINFRLETDRAENHNSKAEKEEYPLWLKIHFNHNHSL